MHTKHLFTAFAAALALITGSWIPGTAAARGFVAQAEPEIEFTEDVDESSLLTVRNGIALSGLVRAALADGDRTVTVVTDDAVVYEVSFDADGQYTQVLNHGGILGSEWEVAAAVSEFDREGGYEAILAGDQDPHVDLELDIEGRIGGEIIGMTDVIAGPDYIEMIVVMDPTAIGFDLDWIIQVVLPSIVNGPCSEEGYVGELCDTLGTITGCACLDMKNPDNGKSILDEHCDPDAVDAFDSLYDNDYDEPQEEETAESKNQRKAAEDDEEDDDEITDPDDIAPWTEGPMLLVDEIDALVLAQTFEVAFQDLDPAHFAQ